MEHRFIEAKDIEIRELNTIILIFGVNSEYFYAIEDKGASEIRYKDETIWVFGGEWYPGWQLDAKEAVVKHSNNIAKQKRGR